MNKWILETIGSYRYPLAALIIIQILCASLVSLQPRYYQKIVSLVIREAGSSLLSVGLPKLAVLAAIYLSEALLQGLGGYIGCVFSSSLLKRLQVEFFNKVSHLRLPSVQRHSGGEFFTRFNNDIGMAQSFFSNFIPSAAREVIIAVIVTSILFYACPAVLTCAA